MGTKTKNSAPGAKQFSFGDNHRPLLVAGLYREMEARETRLSALRLVQRGKPTDERAEEITQLAADIERCENMIAQLSAEG